MTIALCQRSCPEYIVPLFERLSRRFPIEFVFSLFGKDQTFFFNPEVMRNLRYTRLPPPAIPLRPSTWRVLNKPVHWLHVLLLGRALARHLARGDYGLFVAGDFATFECLVAFLVARRSRRPFILWSDAWRWPVTRRDRLKLPLVRWMVRRATALVAGGTLARDTLVALGGRPEAIVNVYHTNVTAHEPVAPAADGDVLYVGRLDERKGLEVLLRAFATVRAAHPRVRLAVVGRGERRARLEALARELGVADAVRFAGWVDHREIDAYYRGCAVFVLPSIFTDEGGYEPFSNVVLEAMAWGRPVISTTANGASFDVIQDGVNGLVVPERDPAALARALGRLLDDRDAAETMGRRARETIRDHFNVDLMARRFAEAIERVEARPG